MFNLILPTLVSYVCIYKTSLLLVNQRERAGESLRDPPSSKNTRESGITQHGLLHVWKLKCDAIVLHVDTFDGKNL